MYFGRGESFTGSDFGALLQGCTAPAALAWAIVAYLIQGVAQQEQQEGQRRQIDLTVLPDLRLKPSFALAPRLPDNSLPITQSGDTWVEYDIAIENLGGDIRITFCRIGGWSHPMMKAPFHAPSELRRLQKDNIRFQHHTPVTNIQCPAGPLVLEFVDVLDRPHRWEYPVIRGFHPGGGGGYILGPSLVFGMPIKTSPYRAAAAPAHPGQPAL